MPDDKCVFKWSWRNLWAPGCFFAGQLCPSLGEEMARLGSTQYPLGHWPGAPNETACPVHSHELLIAAISCPMLVSPGTFPFAWPAGCGARGSSPGRGAEVGILSAFGQLHLMIKCPPSCHTFPPTPCKPSEARTSHPSLPALFQVASHSKGLHTSGRSPSPAHCYPSNVQKHRTS